MTTFGCGINTSLFAAAHPVARFPYNSFAVALQMTQVVRLATGQPASDMVDRLYRDCEDVISWRVRYHLMRAIIICQRCHDLKWIDRLYKSYYIMLELYIIIYIMLIDH